MGPFEVESKHIESMNDSQLTRLLKRLLHLEADEFGLPRSASEVPLEINVSDEGDDGFIRWEGGRDELDFVRNRFTMFQSKSGKTKMRPLDFRMEMVKRAGDSLKGRIKDVLDERGCYTFFLGFPCKPALQKRRIKACRDGLRSLNRTDADSADIRIYDSGKIADWVNKYFAAQVFVRYCAGSDVPWGLKTWEDWAGHDDYQFSYVGNAQLEAHIRTMRDYFCMNKKAIVRVTGLSGLGKTRLALETFRCERSATNSIQLQALQSKVVYFDASNGGAELVSYVADTRTRNVQVLLTVDNCDSSLHERLVKEAGYRNRKIGLLTLDFNPEKVTPEYRSIYLTQKDCKGVVKGILQEAYPGLGTTTISRIEEFAQDFPSIAVFLAKQVQTGLEEIGHIQNKAIVKKLLWGRDPADEEVIKILTACSLFEYFEFSSDSTAHLKFLSKEIAEVEEKKFYKTCVKYKERGILQCRGRYMRVSPIPLAITLAADWWSSVPTSFAKSIIDKVGEAGLAEQFSEQIRKLHFSPNVRALTEDLCGNEGPFGDPGVLLSKEGSRLFRALVEVNPQATAQALFDLISVKSQDELLQIKDDVRRNLVWAIERLCWWKDTFSKASTLMLALASSENEGWSNNATGQFLQLFHVYLPGTEANLQARLQIIRDALKSDISGERELAVRALANALDTDGFSRGSGAEAQGSRLPKRDYEPTGQEIHQYLQECIGLLKDQITGNTEFSELAKSLLTMKMRGLLGCGMIDEIEAAIGAIVGSRGPYWPQALVAVRNTLDYDAERLSSDGLARIKDLEQMLLPQSLEDRLRLIVSIPDRRNRQDDNGNYVSIAAEEAEKLAEELSRDTSWYDQVELLLKGEQRQICAFGVKLGALVDDPKKFINACLNSLTSICEEEARPELIGFFLRGLSDKCLVSETMNRIVSHKKFVIHTVRITRCLDINEEHVRRLMPLIKENKVPIKDLEMFSFGKALDEISADFVMEFCKEIAKHSMEGTCCAFDVLYMYCYQNESRFHLCVDEFRKLIMTPNFLRSTRKNSIITHNWEVVCTKLLSQSPKDNELAIYLTKEILTICVSSDAHCLLPTRNAKVVLSTILRDYFDDCWPIVGGRLVEDRPTAFSWPIRCLLGTGHEKEESVAIVTDLPEDRIIKWCKQNEPEGPVVMAGLMPIFSGEDPVSWHPFAKRIINEFGHISRVLDALIGNLISFPSIGSRVPYYDRRIKLLNSLLDHKKGEVRRWAESGLNYLKNQKGDAQREAEEWQWGIA
jgi:hypothetical protein